MKNLQRLFSRTQPVFALAISLFFALVATSCTQIANNDGQQTVEQADTTDPVRPNILFIIAEDLSPRVGAYGDAVANTPVLDAFAEESLLFENVFTAAGVCSPSRSAMITGMHQQSIGTMHMRTSYKGAVPGFTYEAVTPPGVKAFPELLRAAGYYVINNAKTDYQFGEPFTIWDETSSTAHWRSRPEGKPFFSMITIVETHESYVWDPEMDDPDETAQRVTKRNREYYKSRPSDTRLEDVVVPPYYPDTPVVRAALARHYDNIHFMDTRVGEILADLEADGLAENTIVIWTTDHGDGLPRAKRSLYEGGLKVPLMVRFPDGYGAGQSREDLISFVDLAPTILALAGVDIPSHLQGIDFLDDAQSAKNAYIYGAVDRLDGTYERSRAVRSDRYKYIRNYLVDKPFFHPLHFRDRGMIMKELHRLHRSGELNDIQNANFAAPRPEEELYDLWADPDEINNLVADPANSVILNEMRAELDRHSERVGDMGRIPEKEMYLDMWPGGVQPITLKPQINLQIAPSGKMLVNISDATDGASIGYRITGDEHVLGDWQLYVGPFEIESDVGIETKAIRYGYRESGVVAGVLDRK